MMTTTSWDRISEFKTFFGYIFPMFLRHPGSTTNSSFASPSARTWQRKPAEVTCSLGEEHGGNKFL
jgi:hypothetical protein